MTNSKASKTSVQFHALPVDISSIVESVAKNFNVNLCLVRTNPFSTELVRSAGGLNSIIEAGFFSVPSFELFVTALPLNLPAISQIDFYEKNMDGLSVLFSLPQGRTLRESLISGRVSSARNRAVVKHFVRCLEETMMTGGRHIGPSGAELPDNTHMYSRAALDFFSGGGDLLQLAGTVKFVPSL